MKVNRTVNQFFSARWAIGYPLCCIIHGWNSIFVVFFIFITWKRIAEYNEDGKKRSVGFQVLGMHFLCAVSVKLKVFLKTQSYPVYFCHSSWRLVHYADCCLPNGGPISYLQAVINPISNSHVMHTDADTLSTRHSCLMTPKIWTVYAYSKVMQWKVGIEFSLRRAGRYLLLGAKKSSSPERERDWFTRSYQLQMERNLCYDQMGRTNTPLKFSAQLHQSAIFSA